MVAAAFRLAPWSSSPPVRLAPSLARILPLPAVHFVYFAVVVVVVVVVVVGGGVPHRTASHRTALFASTDTSRRDPLVTPSVTLPVTARAVASFCGVFFNEISKTLWGLEIRDRSTHRSID